MADFLSFLRFHPPGERMLHCSWKCLALTQPWRSLHRVTMGCLSHAPSHLPVLSLLYCWSRGMGISCLITACCVSLRIIVAVSSVSESVMSFSMAYLRFEFLISEKPGRVKFWLNMFSKNQSQTLPKAAKNKFDAGLLRWGKQTSV